MDVAEAAEKAQLLYRELARPFVGREEEARVLVLAVISAEHAILVGEPGTAKSALARRLAGLINARFFKYLLTKYTEPGELLGPLDIKALREGVYRRITRGKLPEAEIAFLDEIFNANSAVLNSLLSIMQEKVVYDGYSEIRANTWSIIAASNMVPEDPELQALYDRFLYRHRVEPLAPEYWPSLLEASWSIEREGYLPPEPVADMSEIREIHRVLLEKVDVFNVKDKLLRVLMVLEDKGIHVTDRRKGKILKAIAANALLGGRDVAEEEDLFVLKYTVPRDPEDFVKVTSILLEELRTRERVLRELEVIRDSLREVSGQLEALTSFDPRLIDYYKSLKESRRRVQELVGAADDPELLDLASKVVEEIDYLIERIMSKLNM